MTDLTKEELQNLRKLHEAATPGNRFNPAVPTRALGWQLRVNGGKVEVFGDEREGYTVHIAMFTDMADARVAIAARNALPRLLDEVERQRQMNYRVLEELDIIADTVPGDAAGPHFGAAEWHKIVLDENAKLSELLRKFQGIKNIDAFGLILIGIIIGVLISFAILMLCPS